MRKLFAFFISCSLLLCGLPVQASINEYPSATYSAAVKGSIKPLQTSRVNGSFNCKFMYQSLNGSNQPVQGITYKVEVMNNNSGNWIRKANATSGSLGNIAVNHSRSYSFQLKASNYYYYTNYSKLTGTEKAKADKNLKTGRYYKTYELAKAAYNRDVETQKKTYSNQNYKVRITPINVPSQYKTPEAKTFTVQYKTSETKQKGYISKKQSISSSSSSTSNNSTYILNNNSKKIHHSWCVSVKRMNVANRRSSQESLAALKAKGYSTCKNCFK